MGLDDAVARAIRQGMAEQRTLDADALVREVMQHYQSFVLREAHRVRRFAENRIAAATN